MFITYIYFFKHENLPASTFALFSDKFSHLFPIEAVIKHHSRIFDRSNAAQFEINVWAGEKRRVSSICNENGRAMREMQPRRNGMSQSFSHLITWSGVEPPSPA